MIAMKTTTDSSVRDELDEIIASVEEAYRALLNPNIANPEERESVFTHVRELLARSIEVCDEIIKTLQREDQPTDDTNGKDPFSIGLYHSS